jgi:hypothetical protein
MPEGQPLPQVIPPELFPLDRLDPGGNITEVLSQVLVTDSTRETTPASTRYSVGLTVAEELALNIVGLDGFAVVLGGASTETLWVGAEITSTSLSVIVSAGARLRFPRSILKPVTQVNGVWVDDPNRAFAEIAVSAGAIIDDTGNVTFDGANAFTLQPAMIADSGFVIEGQVALDLSETTGLPESAALGLSPTWQGVVFRTLIVHMPSAITDAVPISNVAFEDFHIGSGGVSGRIRLNGAPGGGALAGFPFTPTAFEILLKQNALIGATLAGQLTLPFFDAPLDVEVGFDLSGNMSIEIGRNSGGLVTVNKPGLLAMTIESVAFEREGGLFTIALGGTLTPEVAGLEWPTFRIDRLSIDNEGHVRADGGWLDLPDQYSLGFYGFQLSISRMGFGTETDGTRWIGFNGALRLVDGLSAGASVEGMRMRWSPTGAFNPSLSLEGVGVEFEVPDTVSFKGLVSMREPAPGVFRFDGGIELQLIALGLSIDGQLVIGYNESSDFTFFAIYVGVELPAGLPLWSTGLGLYGLAGLFALNMEPGRQQNEAWYAVQPEPSWYHRNPPGIGVADLAKWDDAEGSLGFGAGITIGTVVDNGFTFAGKMLFVIVFPGPILMLEGRANILRERASLSDEPIFRALVVLDRREGTVLAGLDAKYAIADGGELIDIAGSLEAFFDFDDLDAWHLYLGVDEPREKRIGADIFFHLFRAESYLMINPNRLRTGAWVGLDMSWDFGPLHVVLQAWMEGRADLSFKPAYLQGLLSINGGFEVSVFGFGFSLNATAALSAGVFDPFYLRADLSVYVDLPWPISNISKDIVLEWGPETDPPLLPATVKEVAVAHDIVSTTWPLPAGSLLLPKIDTSPVPGFFEDEPPALPDLDAPPPQANGLPVVPLDARPEITFGRPIHDEALVGVNPQMVYPGASPVGWAWIGDPASSQGPARVRPTLNEVRLDRWSGGQWLPIARSGVTGNPAGVPRLIGAWMPTPDDPGGASADSKPANVKLRVWSKTPFTFTSHTGGEWDNGIVGTFPRYPCIDIPEDRKECCGFASYEPGTRLTPPWSCEGNDVFSLTWPPRLRPVIEDVADGRGLCFPSGSLPTILLHESVKSVRLTVHAEKAFDRNCLDLRGRRASRGKNPRSEGKYVFTAYADGGSPDGFTAIGIATLADGSRIAGVNTARETHIDLLEPASSLSMWISTSTPPVFVTAYDADGMAAGPVAVTEQERLTRIKLDAPAKAKFTRVVLTASKSNTAYVHEICGDKDADEPVWADALDGAGTLLNRYTEIGGTIDIDARGAATVVVGRDLGRFCILRACATVGLDPGDYASYENASAHIVDALSVWQSEGEVLPPHSTIRLLICTKLDVVLPPGSKVAAGFGGMRVINQVAYFRTEGPPGLAGLTHSGNALVPGAGGAGVTAAPTIETGLEDLTRYVAQTVPSTVPPLGQQPTLTRPVYRGYDVGVVFGQNYVDAMYALSGRDLSLMIFDNNDQPVRDEHDRLLIAPNRWGRTDALSLSDAEHKWLEVLSGAHCTGSLLDLGTVMHNQVVGLSGFVLDPVTSYEARLQPMLLHETFAGFEQGSTAAGTGALLEGSGQFRWRVADYGTSGAQSLWRVGEAGVPLAPFIEQTSTVSFGPVSETLAFPGGTLLTAAANKGMPAGHSDQPSKWTDYRVSAYVRSIGNHVGLAVRVSGRRGYLVKLDHQRNRRQLILLRPGPSLVLAESSGSYTPGFDIHLSIEAIGSRIRVHADGELLFDVTDASRASGTIALYAGDNPGARFTDVRVDDLRATAPVVYRFEFTSSAFVNFCHHLQSATDRVFRAPAADPTIITAAHTSSIDLADPKAHQPALEAEGRAYESVADTVLGSAARKPLTTVEATRVVAGVETSALLLRTAEPIDWRRTTLSLTTTSRANSPVPATGAKLIDAGFAAASAPNPVDESATVLLLEPRDLTGHAIECRSLSSPSASDLPEGTLLYPGDFITSSVLPIDAHEAVWSPGFNDLSELSLVVPAGSGMPQWQATAGVLSQTGAFQVPDLPWALPVPRERGTLALRIGSSIGNLRFTATIDVPGAGSAGLIFRYKDNQNYYRFAINRARNRRYLVRFLSGTMTVLHASALPSSATGPQSVTIQAVGDRLSVSVNGISVASVTDTSFLTGNVGFYTNRDPQARFSSVAVHGLISRVGDWRIDDVSPTGERSIWRIENGLLWKDQSLTTPPPAGTGFAVVAGAAWDDVKIVTALATIPGSVSPFGLVWRYVSVGEHVRLVLDPVTPDATIVRRAAGFDSVVWTGVLPPPPVAGSPRVLEIEAVGRRIRLSVDGAAVADVADSGLGLGSVGGFGDHGTGIQIWPFTITHAVPRWESWYVFGAERLRTSGRRIRVTASVDQPGPPPAGEDYAWGGHAAGGFRPAFPAEGIDLRLTDPSGQTLHARRFMPDSAYTALSTRIVRAADGTGVVFLPADGVLPDGEIMISFEYRRDNSNVDADSPVLSEAGERLPETVRISVF